MAANLKLRMIKIIFWALCLSMAVVGVFDTVQKYAPYSVYFYYKVTDNIPAHGAPRESLAVVHNVPLSTWTNNTNSSSSFHSATTQTKTTHIGFLKVHKAGSTTLQNMLFRFGLKHGLNIVVPKGGHYLFSENYALVPPNFTHYDIFASHTIYSKRFYDKLLPADSVKIGIIREPFDRMMSAAYYYRDVLRKGYLKDVPVNKFIHNMVNHPEKYEKGTFSRTKNSMGQDFGFPRNINASETDRINAHLSLLGKEFSLVLVTEQFEESLILMKRLLNWSFSDIIYRTTNTYKHKETELTKDELKLFKSTNFLDYAVYEFFNNILKQKLTEGGEDLVEEVKLFKDILANVKDFCETDPSKEKKLVIEKSKWDHESYLTGADCIVMKIKELDFFPRLRKMYKTGKPISYDTVLSYGK